MLAVSFIGKKFCCDAQFEVADEIDGDGLKLNLKVRETCHQFLKPPGPVLATLHVSLNNGRRNDVTKCKELLAFLKEQVLPKTMKLISLKRIQKVKDEEKSEGVNLLSCIWPGKTRKRKEETKNNCARGYSSDTESSLGRSSISEIDVQYQASSKAGILATPMHAHTKLLHTTHLKTNEDVLGDTKKNSAQKKMQDENKALNHSLKRISLEKGEHGVVKIAHNNLATALDTNTGSYIDRCSTSGSVGYGRVESRSTDKDRDKKQDKVQYRSEAGLQRVQNEQPDWNSCSDISAGRSFVGFGILNKSIKRAAKSSTIEENALSRKQGNVKFVKSNELGLKAKSNCLLIQEVVENNSGHVEELCAAQKSQLKIFAAEYVGRICEIALSRKVKETSEAFARDFVENVVSLAKRQVIDCKNSHDTGKIRDCEEHPSFSKVWKYSQVFAPDHEISESLRIKDSREKDKELDTCSKHCEKEDAQVINDYQHDAELESEMVGSPMSSNNSLSRTSSNSSDVSMELCKSHANTESFSTYDLDNEVNIDSALEKSTNQPLEGDKGNAASIDDLTSIPRLGEIHHESQKETTTSKYPQDDQSSCCNNEKSEDNETATTSSQSHSEGKQTSANIFTRDLSDNAVVPSNGGRLQPGTKGAGKLAAKKQQNGLKTESNYRRRPLYKRALSESQASERRQWCSTGPEDEDLQTRFHSSCRSISTALKHVRSSSCPVVSEDDVLIESMLSHHEDVYDSLAKRTWIILHVHELWNGGKPMDAIKTCIELTGMADVENDLGTTSRFGAPYTLVSRDYALFLNILQQLPSSCSMWTLDLCVLVLPKLKGFISTQHHSSHVEMACSIVHVVLKKVGAVARRTSKGTKNKDKEQKVKVCTTELKEIKDMTSDVIQTVKSVKKNNTDDPGSMKSTLKELQLALGTFLSSVTAS